jgi:hypothetical protein
MSSSPDPIDEWRAVSERAARGTGYQPRPVVVPRPAPGFGLGAALLVVVLVAGGLVLRPWAGRDAGSDGPVVASTDDGMFRLTLTTPHGVYRPTDAIEPVATLTYLGPEPSVEIAHATKAIQFRIEEIDGPGDMGGGTRLPCLSESLSKGAPIEVRFAKSGSPDDLSN